MTGTFEARTISMTIERPPAEVYAFAVVPENLPRWASGLGSSGERVGADWVSQTAQGPVRIRFAERNDLGVLDHDVTLPGGDVVHNPMRVVPNGSGSEVSFTLFRRPGVTDEALEEDAATIDQDLRTLKRLVEG